MQRIYGRLAFALLGVALALSLFQARQAEAQGVDLVGQVTGRVVNGTADGTEPGAGLPVRLRLVRGATDQEVIETTTGVDGSFRFEGLDTDPELEYWPEAVYLGVSYSTAEPVRFDAGQTERDVTLTVYETTADDSDVRVDSVHMIAESFGQMMRVTEIHLFSNAGERTYIGADDTEGMSTTVFIPLPKNAVGLAFDQETAPGRFVEVEGGLKDTRPVPPGEGTSMTFFSYHLASDGETVPVEKSFAYPVVALNLLAAQPGLTVRSDQLESRGIQSFQGQQFEFYAAEDIAPDSLLSMEFVPVTQPAGAPGTEGAPTDSGASSNTPAAATQGNQPLLRWFGYGLALLAVVAAVVYPLASRRPAAAPEPATDLTSTPEARRLLAELADLEDTLAAGQIDEASYERRRTEIHQVLKSL